MDISHILGKYKAQYIVILLTGVYWLFALTARFYPEIFMAEGRLYSIYIELAKGAILINIINIILLIIMIYFKVWQIKYLLIFLGINVLTAFIGMFFIGYPSYLM